MRSFDDGITRETEIAIALIVGDDEDDVGSGGCSGRGGSKYGKNYKKGERIKGAETGHRRSVKTAKGRSTPLDAGLFSGEVDPDGGVGEFAGGGEADPFCVGLGRAKRAVEFRVGVEHPVGVGIAP